MKFHFSIKKLRTNFPLNILEEIGTVPVLSKIKGKRVRANKIVKRAYFINRDFS